MALQAGKDVINYAPIDRTRHPAGYNNYIAAIHEGFGGNYERIKRIFLTLISGDEAN